MSSETQKQEMRDLLYGFEKHGVPRIHLECLMWFYENENKIVDNETLRGKQIEGKSKKGYPFSARRPIPPNDIVHNHHYLHTGVRGWYKPKGEKIIRYDEQKREPVWEGQDTFVQSLQTGTGESLEGYGKEIELDENSNWDRINYNHNSKTKYYEITGGYISRCYGHKLPIGIIFKQGPDKNKIMGLGEITNISQNQLDYTLRPYHRFNDKKNSQFQFEKNDFDLIGSTTQEDALYRNKRLGELRKEIKTYFKYSYFEYYDSLRGKPNNRVFTKGEKTTYRGYSWLSFWHGGKDNFDTLQYQIVLTDVNPPLLSVGVFLEGYAKNKKNRIRIIEQLAEQKNQIFNILKQLSSKYKISLKYDDDKSKNKEWKISKFGEDDLELIINELSQTPKSKLKIAQYFTESEAVSLKTDVVDKISKIFHELFSFEQCCIGNNLLKKINSEVSLDEIANKILKGPPEIAVEKNIVLRILKHLESGKHVILVGAPGVGKTMLSKRILEIYGKIKTGEEYLPSVATAEWSRYHVIGGINLQQDTWNTGVVSKAAESGKWLLIDEFNRADINKAFGEMFFAIEDKKIPLTDEEQKISGKKEIIIPDEFRMIGTMNDYDKNLLLTELSYGLITRFAFIDIEPDKNKEKESVKNQIITGNLDIDNEDWENCKKEINNYFEFVEKVRQIPRMIGVRTTIDILRYVIYSSKSNDGKASNNKVFLDEALCDYLLPQFDRLDKNTIVETEKASKSLGTEKFTSGLTKMKEDLKKMSGILDDQDD